MICPHGHDEGMIPRDATPQEVFDDGCELGIAYDPCPDCPRVMMGTTAIHLMGDISRDKPDYFYVDSEDDENYYGAWLTGFGFIEVRFPKATSREMTDAEREWLSRHRVVIS